MERVIPEHYSLSNAQQPRSLTGVRAIMIVILYALLVAGATVTGGYRLYQAARWAVVNSYPIVSASALPVVDRGDNAATDGQVAVLPSSQSDAAVSTVQDASALAPINILLLGTDDRPDENGPPRTDTIILLTLDPQSHTAGMLSLPRDLWVPIPGYGYNAKINTAYGLGETRSPDGGGAQLVVDTVSQLVGRPVDYYVRINFQGFIQMVDLLGGIDLIVTKTIHDEEYPTADYGVETFHLDAGLQHLDGETALKYARTRHTDDDYGRARRQQEVIRAVADKVLRLDMIPTLLPKAWMLVSTMRSSIDTNIPILVQYELAGYMRAAALREIRQDVLDSRYGEETITEDAGWILIPDREKVRSALNHFFIPPVAEAATPEGATGDPHWVRIEVLNGTGEPGIAARTRSYLEAQGWQVVAIGDADRSDYSKTVVVNYGVPDLIIERVRHDLELQADFASIKGLNSAQPIDLRIVVGRDMLSTIQ